MPSTENTIKRVMSGEITHEEGDLLTTASMLASRDISCPMPDCGRILDQDDGVVIQSDRTSTGQFIAGAYTCPDHDAAGILQRYQDSAEELSLSDVTTRVAAITKGRTTDTLTDVR